MVKLKAVSIHFAISFTVVASVLAVIFTQWYPAPYFAINGASNVLRTLIAVDLVLGPLLTAVLYRPGKWGLKFDMAFVAVVQLSALIYGTSIIYQERPQFMVFAVDRFVVLPEVDLVRDQDSDIDACAGFAVNPCVAVAVVPVDLKAREALMFRTFEEEIDIEQLPEYWVSLAQGLPLVLKQSQPLERIASAGEVLAREVSRLSHKHQRDAQSMRYLPVFNKRLESMVLVIDATNAEVLDVIDVDPWELPKDADRADQSL